MNDDIPLPPTPLEFESDAFAFTNVFPKEILVWFFF